MDGSVYLFLHFLPARCTQNSSAENSAPTPSPYYTGKYQRCESIEVFAY